MQYITYVVFVSLYVVHHTYSFLLIWIFADVPGQLQISADMCKCLRISTNVLKIISYLQTSSNICRCPRISADIFQMCMDICGHPNMYEDICRHLLMSQEICRHPFLILSLKRLLGNQRTLKVGTHFPLVSNICTCLLTSAAVLGHLQRSVSIKNINIKSMYDVLCTKKQTLHT